tara:strand:- start:3 stop:152 length:150 start_codon:yes stop_codon:yes gene_type:complete
MTEVNEARKALEKELQRVTGKPSQILTERLIDMMQLVWAELRKTDYVKK